MNLKIALGIIAAIVVIDGVLYASYQGDFNKMDQLKKEISQENQNGESMYETFVSEQKEITQKKAQMDNIKSQIDKLNTTMSLLKMYPSEYNKDVEPYNALVDQYNALRVPYNAL